MIDHLKWKLSLWHNRLLAWQHQRHQKKLARLATTIRVRQRLSEALELLQKEKTMIEVKLELTEETTLKDLLEFATLAAEHGLETTRVVHFKTPEKGETQVALAFKPHMGSKKTLHKAQPNYRGEDVTHIGGRPIDTL